MKKNLTIALIFLLGLSWFVTLNSIFGNPKKYDELVNEGKRLEEKGLYVNAIEVYEEAMDLKTDQYEIKKIISDAYLSMEDYKSYKRSIKKLIEEYGPKEELVNDAISFYEKNSSRDGYVNYVVDLYALYPDDQGIQNHYNQVKKFYKIDYDKFDFIGEFQGDYACIIEEGKYGFINQKGDYILDPIYEEVKFNGKDDDEILVKDQGKYYFVNLDGFKTVEPDLQFESMDCIRNGMIRIKDKNKVGYISSRFKERIPASYDEGTAFNKGVAAVKKGDKWGIINKDGENVTDFIFDDIAINSVNVCYENGLIGVCKEGNWYFIDKKGERAFDQNFQSIKAFEGEEACAVLIDGKWCFMDSDGTLHQDIQCEEAKSFSNGNAAVKMNGAWGYIDLDYFCFLEAQFEETSNLTENGVAAIKADGKWSLMQLTALE